MKKKCAFTLAEVLITLVIIGIVAAVTIPSVIANYQQQEFKTGLRKAVSVLNEAIQANIAIEGETPYDRKIYLSNYLKRHMSTLKNETGSPNIGCFEIGDNKHQCMGKNEAFYTTDGMRFELTVGSHTLLESSNSTPNTNLKLHESGLNLAKPGSGQNSTLCGSYGLANNPYNTKQPPCFILVDINGDKKPTVYGANVVKMDNNGSVKRNYVYPSPTDKRVTDIFPILITEDRAIPFGVVAQRAMYEK